MSKKIIAGVLSLILTVSSMGADVFAEVSADPADGGKDAVVQETVDADTDAEDEEAVPDEEKQTEDEKAEPREPAADETDGVEDQTDADGDGNPYYILFMPGSGGLGDTYKMECKPGEEYVLPECQFSHNGFVFVEWNISEDGSDTHHYKPGDKVTNLAEPEGQVKLYAIWTPEYNITYELDGGVNDKDNPDKYDETKLPVVFKNPVKDFYKFDGWYDDAQFTTKITQLGPGTTGNKQLYAKWIPYKYSVKFDGNGATGGSTPEMTGCEYDKNYNLTVNGFVKKGYDFTGWNTKADGTGTAYADKASVKNLSATDGGSVTFFAQWKIATYKLTYNLNGGKNDPGNPSSYNVNSNTIKLKDATRKGYAFEGWYSDSSFKNKVTKIASGSTGDKVFYAKWKANTYTVKFNGNGATSGKMSDLKNRKYGKEYTLEKNKFKRKGYTFTGWNTKANGKGKSYSNKAKIKNLTARNKGTVTFYAQWKIKGYKITYVLNKGKNDKRNPETYNIKTKTIKLYPAKRTGYTFDGWYSDKSFKHKVTKIKKGSTGNKTLYAKWKVNKYRIKFYGNHADRGSMSDMKGCKYGKKYKLKPNKFKRDGYIFKEWNTKPDGSGKSYDDEETVKNLSKKNGGVVKLYAIWSPIVYTVVFEGNGATSGTMKEITCVYDTSYVLPANTFTKKRYRFDCWSTKKDGSGKCFVNKDTIKNLTTVNGDKVKLYAQWEEDFTQIAMNVSRPSKENIRSFMYNHPYSSSDSYAQLPSLKEPYSAGRLSTQTLTSSINLFNTYRYIAGVHTNVQVSDTYCDHASKGTLLNKLNNQMSHYPARPAVLMDSKYDSLYADGSDGCKNSNLASGFPSMSMRSAIDMWMNDSDKDNISMVGHRRWILYPSLSQVGFGKADYNTGAGGSFCAAYVNSGSISAYTNTRVAWPANNTPTGMFDDDTAWSLSMGRVVDASKIKVKVVRDRDHKVWTFTSSSADGDFYVNNGGYGAVGCIIFRPEDLEVKADESYTVKVFFYDNEEMVKYNVNFFSL